MNIEEIKKVKLEDDDVLVIRCGQFISAGQREAIREAVNLSFPKNKVTILDGGLSIDVVCKGDL